MDNLSVLLLKLLKEKNIYLNCNQLYALTGLDLLTTAEHLMALWGNHYIDARLNHLEPIVKYTEDTSFPTNGEFKINLNGIAFLENIEKENKEKKFNRNFDILNLGIAILALLISIFK